MIDVESILGAPPDDEPRRAKAVVERTAARSAPAAPAAAGTRAMTPAAQARLRAMFDDHFDFIWRVLRRMGVLDQNAKDAAQQVFFVAARKIDAIDEEKARSFLLGAAIRIAADGRRAAARSREVASDAVDQAADRALDPEAMTEKKRSLELFDVILGAMTFELRTVFVLYEVEAIGTHDIAAMLGVPRGTVASRLRRARDEFEAIAKREHARAASKMAQRAQRGGEP